MFSTAVRTFEEMHTTVFFTYVIGYFDAKLVLYTSIKRRIKKIKISIVIFQFFILVFLVVFLKRIP